MRGIWIARGTGGVALALLAGTALAESVSMTGKFPAEQRDVALLRSLAIEQFSGRDGPALSLALERALSGSQHFALVPVGRGGDAGNAEGFVTGTVSTGVQELPWTKTEKKCVEKEGSKCLREEQVKIQCTRRIVEFEADVRVADAVANRVLYSVAKPKRDEQTWCAGQNPARTAEATVRSMITAVAGELAIAFAPRVETYAIRFREGTKGMPKDVAKTFKAVVKQSQRDLPGACAGWAALDAQLPNHPSVVFDLGLCAEATGDHVKAAALYDRARALMERGSEADIGADRVARLIAAKADDAKRDRRR